MFTLTLQTSARLLALIVVASFTIVACSSKKKLSTSGSGAADEPSAVQWVKTPTEVTEASAGAHWAKDKIYFANLRILTELQSDCDLGLAKSERFERQLEAQLETGPEKPLLVIQSGVNPMPRAIFNVRLRSVGFDEIEMHGSLYSGSETDWPYGLKVRWRPDSSLEIHFLGQIQRIKLETTPVASFSAEEVRGACKISHSVNIFSENAGDYPFRLP